MKLTPNQWHPIEMAPKDGTLVELWILKAKARFSNYSYDKETKTWVSWTEYDIPEKAPTHFMIIEGPKE